MNNSEHEHLAFRLSEILFKLNQGETLNIASLAEEFRTSTRTIQRDLQERLSFLPFEKTEKGYALDPAYMGKLTYRDIKRFASLAGLKGLFPALDDEFIRDLFDIRLQDAIHIHGSNFEDISKRRSDFKKISDAITQNKKIAFTYTKSDEESKSVEVEPYRLVSNSGIWYLAAVSEEQIKAYAFGKISLIRVLEHIESFTKDQAKIEMLDREDSIWLNEKKTEVVLTVSSEIAHYFQRRKLISQQKIEKELEDGGLIISGKFAHTKQLFPIMRYWIPHIRVVSPIAWQDELEQGLREYLSDC